MKNANFIKTVFLSCFTTLVGCSHTSSSFMEINKLYSKPRHIETVEYYAIEPKRSAICLGQIHICGNRFSDHEKLIQDAKRKAADLGGDFIFEEKSGVETKVSVTPAYSTYQSNGSTYLNGNSRYVHGSANENAYGYSVGPSVQTLELPWAVFYVGVYTPSQFGVRFDDNAIITGFHLNSDGEPAGLKVGDKIIGVDGIDAKDEGLSRHIMSIQPGDKIVLSVQRDAKRLDYAITALIN